MMSLLHACHTFMYSVRGVAECPISSRSAAVSASSSAAASTSSASSNACSAGGSRLRFSFFAPVGKEVEEYRIKNKGGCCLN